jgi:hypothetical protein
MTNCWITGDGWGDEVDAGELGDGAACKGTRGLEGREELGGLGDWAFCSGAMGLGNCGEPGGLGDCAICRGATALGDCGADEAGDSIGSS